MQFLGYITYIFLEISMVISMVKARYNEDQWIAENFDINVYFYSRY